MCLLEGPAFPAELHSLSTVEDLCHISTTVGSCLRLMSLPEHCSSADHAICLTANLKHAGPAARCLLCLPGQAQS